MCFMVPQTLSVVDIPSRAGDLRTSSPRKWILVTNSPGESLTEFAGVGAVQQCSPAPPECRAWGRVPQKPTCQCRRMSPSLEIGLLWI